MTVEVAESVIAVVEVSETELVLETITIVETVEIGIEGPQGPPGVGGVFTREVATGVIDGVNTTFTTAYEYVAGTLSVYLNGLMESPTFFTESPPTTVVLDEAPIAGDLVVFTYVR